MAEITINSEVSVNISDDIKIPESSVEEVIEELKKATIESLSKDVKVSLSELKRQASIFLSSVKTLSKEYENFTRESLNKIIRSQPEAALYVRKGEMEKERLYVQSLYMLLFHFDEFLSRFRKEDERKVIYVFEDKNTGKLDSYEMNYRELVVNANKTLAIDISKERLQTNKRTSLESKKMISEDKIKQSQIAYNAVNNRLERYFETHKGAQKQGGIIMWRKGKNWMLGNVQNKGDLKEAYISFLFSNHEDALSKVIESNSGNPPYYSHELVDLFYNNYINKVTNLAAIVEEDVVISNKQYGVKSLNAELPKFQQYINVATAIVNNEINENNIEQIIKEKVNKEAARNIAVKVNKKFRELEKMTAEELKAVYDAARA